MSTRKTLLGAGLLASMLALPGAALDDPGDLEPFDPIPMEPVLVHDTWGNTPGGRTARNLVIYANGRVHYSQSGADPAESFAYASFVTRAELHRLLAEIDSWDHLVDQNVKASELPLQTLTRISDGKASSVSWYAAYLGHQHLEAALDGLKLDLFPWVVD